MQKAGWEFRLFFFGSVVVLLFAPLIGRVGVMAFPHDFLLGLYLVLAMCMWQWVPMIVAIIRGKDLFENNS